MLLRSLFQNVLKQVYGWVFLGASIAVMADPIHPVIIPQSSLMKASLPVVEEDEVVVVERLIQSTGEQLRLQEHLKELMISFQKRKESFIQGDQTKKNASVMVRTAREILEIITNQHWQFHFSKIYLDELTIFSSIAGKTEIKRP